MRRGWTVACLIVLAGACTGEAVGAEDELGSETTPPSFDPPPPACGNGYLEDGEQCDDANLEDGDGCDSLCRIPCGTLWETTIPAISVDAEPRVVDLAIGPGGEIVVVGTLRALTAELDDDVWIGAFDGEGAPLWSNVLDPQTDLDQVAGGVAIAADGGVYVSATVDTGDGPDEADIWVARLDLDDGGTQLWSASFGGPAQPSEDVVGGVAVTASGNVVVVGQQRITPMDADLWLAELAAADGAEIWSTTWTGALADNGYSLDRGGPVAIAADGTIWAMGVEYIDYQTFDARLFSFDPSGALLGTWTPHAEESPGHEHLPAGLSVQADGRVYFGVVRLGPGATFWVHALDGGPVAGQITWTREMASFIDDGENWLLGDVAASPDGNVFVGGSLQRDEKDDNWWEGWAHRLDSEGAGLCERRHSPTGATILRPDAYIEAVAATPNGELLISAGRVVDVEDQRSFWVAAFRGP